MSSVSDVLISDTIILSSWSKLSIPALFLNVFKAEISRILKDILGFLFK